MPSFVITILGPDMAAGEITAVLVANLAGNLLGLHLWPPRRPVSRRHAVKVMAYRRAFKARWAA
jgi:hypothetical protein